MHTSPQLVDLEQRDRASARETAHAAALDGETRRTPLCAAAEAASVVVGARSHQELRHILEDACRQVIPFDAFFVQRYDAETHTFHTLGDGEGTVTGSQEMIPAAGTPEEGVIRERSSRLSRRSEDEVLRGDGTVRVARRFESAIRSPILSGDRVLGLLSVHSCTPDLYTNEDVEFVEVIASLAASTFENLQLSEARRTAETKLQEAARQLAETQRIAQIGSWRWSVGSDRVRWSDELFHIYGLTPTDGDVAFEAFVERLHPDDREQVLERIADALQTAEPYELLHRIVRPDGEVRTLHARGEVVRGADGQARELFGTGQDVTVLKEAEERLRSSEESYRTIFELASDAIFVHDIETGAILDANRKACELHGVTLSELKELGVGGISDGSPPYDEATARRYVRKAAEGEPQRFEWRVRNGEGTRFWVEVSLHRVRILGVPRILASVRNIDERKSSETALQQAHDELEQRIAARTAELAQRTRDLECAERRFRAIVEASPMPLLISDLDDGTIRYANDRLETLLGVPEGSLAGRKTPDFYYDPGDRPRVIAAVMRDGYVRDLELQVRRADGSSRWAALSMQQLDYGGRRALATALIDITERKRTESTLRLQKTLLEAQGEASIDGILVVSERGKILSYNRRFVEMWDIPQEVVDARSDEAAIQSVLDKLEDPEAFLARVEHLYEHPQEKARDEISLLDGRVFDRYSAPILSSEGDYHGRIWFFRDVTPQKRHAEELEQARHEAESARIRASRYAKSLERELEFGRQIQQGLLPAELPAPPGWEIAVRFRPVWQVAGDFYDAFELPSGHTGLIIADVSGKGVGAALFMALFQSLLRASAERAGADRQAPAAVLAEAVTATNGYITRVHRHAHMFASVFFGLLDPETGSLHYVNAGHERPIVLAAGGDRRRLGTTGPALGLLADPAFDVARTHLSPGDLLIAFTDGVTEARSDKRDFFTEERLLALLDKPVSAASDALDRIEEAVRDFARDATPADDLTLLAVRRAKS